MLLGLEWQRVGGVEGVLEREVGVDALVGSSRGVIQDLSQGVFRFIDGG